MDHSARAARLCKHHGEAWSGPVTISADGIGYPATVELADGTRPTVWYQREPPQAVVRQSPGRE